MGGFRKVNYKDILLWAKSQLPGISNALLYDYTLYTIKYIILYKSIYIGNLLYTCYYATIYGAGTYNSHVNGLYLSARTNYVMDIVYFIY